MARIGGRPGPMDDDYAALVGAGDVFVLDDLAGLVVLHAESDHLLVHNVAVEPARQGEGLGRALLRFAEARAAALGLPELRLYTHELMTENIELYGRLGWREYDRRRDEGFPRVFFHKAVAQ